MRYFGLFIAALGLGFMVVALVQYETAFLGDELTWALLLGVLGVILIALGAGLVLSDQF